MGKDIVISREEEWNDFIKTMDSITTKDEEVTVVDDEDIGVDYISIRLQDYEFLRNTIRENSTIFADEILRELKEIEIRTKSSC